MTSDDADKSGIKHIICHVLSAAAKRENISISINDKMSFWNETTKAINDMKKEYAAGNTPYSKKHKQHMVMCCCICCGLSLRTPGAFFAITNNLPDDKIEALSEVIYSETILAIFFMHCMEALESFKNDEYQFGLLKEIFTKGCGREKLRLETLFLISTLIQFGFSSFQ